MIRCVSRALTSLRLPGVPVTLHCPAATPGEPITEREDRNMTTQATDQPATSRPASEMQQVGIVDRMNSFARSAGIARRTGWPQAAGVGARWRQQVIRGTNSDLPSRPVSVEQLSFLDFASRQLGTSLETLTNGIGRLQRNLSEVIAGSGPEAARALNTLGLSATELSRQDVVTQLTTIGEALRGIENPAQRAAAAGQLFGTRLSKELLPVLLSGQRNLAELADRFVDLNGVITPTRPTVRRDERRPGRASACVAAADPHACGRARTSAHRALQDAG